MYVGANSVDSDQTALKEQSDQDLHCCHSFYIFWRHYFIVKLNCFILRTTMVAGLGVPIFRVFTVAGNSICIFNQILSVTKSLANKVICKIFR